MAKEKVYSYKKEMVKSAIIIITGIYLLFWAYFLYKPYATSDNKIETEAHIVSVEEISNRNGIYTYNVTWEINDKNLPVKQVTTKESTENKDSYKNGDVKLLKLYIPEGEKEYKVFKFDFNIGSKIIMGVLFISVSVFDIILRTYLEKKKKENPDTNEEDAKKGSN